MTQERQRIAIIGSGISGLGVAYMLKTHQENNVYEKNAYLGGHSRTIEVNDDGKQVPVDTGFIVFNDWNYPNLTALFRILDVPHEKSDMSFGVSIKSGWLEYASGSIFSFRNLLRPQYWGMLKDIVKFNTQAEKYLDRDPSFTLGDVMDDLNMGQWFRDYYLKAMGAAIWSCSATTILDFPARTYIRFFKNHGLINFIKRPQWYTVTGGSREYVKRLTTGFVDKIKLNCGAQKVVRADGRITVQDTLGQSEEFDHVIFACHADEAIALLDNPSADEKAIIGDFSYQPNSIIVHQDESFMPRDRKSWASWVYLSEEDTDSKDVVSLTYWMNNLQNMETSKPLLVTLNPGRRPQEDLILDEHDFTHPIFNEAAIRAQGKVDDLQGQNNTWFCGAYQRYGFHEDGLLSAVKLVRKMGVSIPWN
ncbi:MAG: NAD(P)-binding protein [Pseudomonadota bacterium]